jgi:hypothetical protein
MRHKVGSTTTHSRWQLSSKKHQHAIESRPNRRTERTRWTSNHLADAQTQTSQKMGGLGEDLI